MTFSPVTVRRHGEPWDSSQRWEEHPDAIPCSTACQDLEFFADVLLGYMQCGGETFQEGYYRS